MRTSHLGAALAGAVLSASAATAGTVDVDNLLLKPADTTGWGGATADSLFGFRTGQNWTVGVAGRLETIELVGEADSYIDPSAFDVTLSVYGGLFGSFGGGPLLGSLVKSSTDIAPLGVTTFDFSSLNITAAVGQLLSWEMTIEGCAQPCYRQWVNVSQFFPSGAMTADYAGGIAYGYSPSVGFVANAQDDNFRITMGLPDAPTAAPEPRTWAMMVMGFGALGAVLRGRRRGLAAGA